MPSPSTMQVLGLNSGILVPELCLLSCLTDPDFFLNKIYFYFICMGVCVCLCTACMLHTPRGQWRVSALLLTVVSDSCNYHVCAVLNPYPLEEHPVEPSLQSQPFLFFEVEFCSVVHPFELTLLLRLNTNSQELSCFSLLGSRIAAM